jgi:hypothetical protein
MIDDQSHIPSRTETGLSPHLLPVGSLSELAREKHKNNPVPYLCTSPIFVS